jgi:hypothetical protein
VLRRATWRARPLAWLAKAVLDVTRSIHTLVFGLVLVGIVGLGPTAGILAIALHSMGTYGKLFAEAIETLDMAAIDAVRSVGAGPAQVFFNAVWPAVLPQFVSSHLYVWEFNIRDSTMLGLIGAGGLGLLITEATALFQWGRLSTVLLVVIAAGGGCSTRSAGASGRRCCDRARRSAAGEWPAVPAGGRIGAGRGPLVHPRRANAWPSSAPTARASRPCCAAGQRLRPTGRGRLEVLGTVARGTLRRQGPSCARCARRSGR